MGKMASERRTEAQDRAKAATGSACYSGKVYQNIRMYLMRSVLLVFFGNRGDGLFFWRGVRESWYLLFLRATSQADMLACPFGDCRRGL